MICLTLVGSFITIEILYIADDNGYQYFKIYLWIQFYFGCATNILLQQSSIDITQQRLLFNFLLKFYVVNFNSTVLLEELSRSHDEFTWGQ